MNKEEAKKIFGKNLKELRLSKGMSQEELAHALGFKNRSSINKIELGKNDMPRALVSRAAQVLGVSPIELFEVDAHPNTEADIFYADDKPYIGEVKVLPKDALPDGVFDGELGFRVDLWKTFSSLSDKNQEQVMSYMKYLAEIQKKNEGDNDEQS